MTTWFKQNLTLALVFAVLVALGGFIGTVYVFADDVVEDREALQAHTKDGHPAEVVKLVDKNTEEIQEVKKAVDLKLDEAVFRQFEHQLFQQLDRIEKNLSN